MLEDALRQVALPRNLAYVPGLTMVIPVGEQQVQAPAGKLSLLVKATCEAWPWCLLEIQGSKEHSGSTDLYKHFCYQLVKDAVRGAQEWAVVFLIVLCVWDAF